MKTYTSDLDDDWRTLGFHPRRPTKSLPCPEPREDSVLAWLDEVGRARQTVLTVAGPNPQARGGFYNRIDAGPWTLDRQQSRTWLGRNPLDDWTDRVRRLAPMPEFWDAHDGDSAPTNWRWLWALAGAEDLMITSPLREMVDRPYHLVHDAVRLLMGLRFAILERGDVEGTLSLMTRWMTMGLDTLSRAERRIMEEAGVSRQPSVPTERMDLLLMLLILAEQNGVLGKTVFVFDDLESACTPEHRPRLRELHALMQATQRWAGFTEIPVGLILGFDPRKAPALRRANPKLTLDVLAAMEGVSV